MLITIKGIIKCIIITRADRKSQVRKCLGFCSADTYRVTQVVEYLGWVDLDLGSSTILLGQ